MKRRARAQLRRAKYVYEGDRVHRTISTLDGVVLSVDTFARAAGDPDSDEVREQLVKQAPTLTAAKYSGPDRRNRGCSEVAA